MADSEGSKEDRYKDARIGLAEGEGYRCVRSTRHESGKCGIRGSGTVAPLWLWLKARFTGQR